MNTEYLILHENSINWEQLSKDPSRSFSLAEIRIFRKRINWIEYLKCHNLSHDELTIASKHFTQHDYEFIALNNLADQDFIKEHKDQFNWDILLRNSYLTEDTLMSAREILENFSKDLLKDELESNRLVKLYDGSYDEFLVYMNLKS